MVSSGSINETVDSRAQKLFAAQRQANFIHVDRMFALLLFGQWLGGIACAVWFSPNAWAGAERHVHLHVWTAIFLGGLIAGFPVFLVFKHPGTVLARHTVAIGQMLFSGLLIHFTGGRIETHFHVFGSLAFLAFYRDWRVLITAAVVVAGDHVIRGLLWPQSIYGVLTIQPWRWLEHIWWVTFEEVFLIRDVRRNVALLQVQARKQAELDSQNEIIHDAVQQRTNELQASRSRLALQCSIVEILAANHCLEEAGRLLLRTIGEHTGFGTGAVWWKNGNEEELVCIDFWHESESSVPSFEFDTRKRSFSLGVGLPGRVWQSKQLCIIENVGLDDNFPRAPFAEADGLKGALAFPLLNGEEVLGVMEFFSTQELVSNDNLRQWFEVISKQVSELVRRHQTEALCRRLAAIVQSCADAIIGVGPSRTITAWNAGAERMFGYSAGQALGNPLSILGATVSAAFDRVDWSIDKAEPGQAAESIETVAVRTNGSHIHVSLLLSPIFDHRSFLVGTSVIMRDIGARKEAERRVREFYSMVSHELRTPLASIHGVLRLLEGGVVEPGSEQSVELIQTALVSSERLRRLINDILDLQKIEAAMLELHFERVEPALLVDNVLGVLDRLAQEAGIGLCKKIELLGQEAVIADSDRVTQVLTNLVANAIKFSPRGTLVWVMVHIGRPGFVRFSVRDSGPGISEAHMPKLFGKFQQLDSSDSRAKEGTGLGLAISKAIVEEHGGAIGVDSMVGVGSEFWFELPIFSAPEAAAPEAAAPEAAAPEAAAPEAAAPKAAAPEAAASEAAAPEAAKPEAAKPEAAAPEAAAPEAAAPEAAAPATSGQPLRRRQVNQCWRR